MARKRNRIVVLVIGWSAVALGVLGLILPILPGLALLLVGVSILSSEYIWAHKILQRLRTSFPAFSGRLREAENWARNRLSGIWPKK